MLFESFTLNFHFLRRDHLKLHSGSGKERPCFFTILKSEELTLAAGLPG